MFFGNSNIACFFRRKPTHHQISAASCCSASSGQNQLVVPLWKTKNPTEEVDQNGFLDFFYHQKKREGSFKKKGKKNNPIFEHHVMFLFTSWWLEAPNVFIYIYIPLDLGPHPFYRRNWKGDIYKYNIIYIIYIYLYLIIFMHVYWTKNQCFEPLYVKFRGVMEFSVLGSGSAFKWCCWLFTKMSTMKIAEVIRNVYSKNG